MFSSAEKTNSHATSVQRKAGDAAFFRKANDETFFGAKESPLFFSAPVQAKLSVSSPDDPQEKEADKMAEHVMRMPDPAVTPEKKEEEKLQKKEDDEEVQAKCESQPMIQCQEKEEEQVQAKLFNTIHRSTEETTEAGAGADSFYGNNYSINRKNISLHHSDVIQRSGRGPPADSIPFEQSLSSNKGSGSALPGDTRQFMESRFNADFSGVRIHTGSYAESLSSQIHAQAFTHGNDIYFNSGKYSPASEGGSTLLAHELTHTIQQGASKTVESSSNRSSSSTTVSAKPISVSRKEIIHRSADGVPSQLINAVAKAKTMEGKINAKKPGPDGYRTGWQHLLEIFKSTFGEDKIISGSGGTAIPGTVAEMDIKKYREATGVQIVDPKNTDRTISGNRDSMPSWCGIFVFWALNKSGVPMPKWKLGQNVIKPEAVNPPGYIPKPGDIAWRKAYSHFAIVESVSGDTVKTVNGNTSGSDNMGGQVQTSEHKLSNWTAFFSPLMTATGPLSSGEAPVNEKPKSFADLRKELFKVNRKDENDHEEEAAKNEEVIQPKPELSSWNVDAGGTLQTATNYPDTNNKNLQKKEEEKEEDDKTGLTTQPLVQKKQAYDIHAKCADCTKEEKKVQAKYSVQLKTENADSSLNSYTNAETSAKSVEQDRGPPVQAKQTPGGTVVQRSVVDDALSFIGSVTDCISIDLDKAKSCALRKAQQVALHIPGYKALRVVLGKDPITDEHIERNGRNFIEAAFDIMPGGSKLHRKLDEQHQLDAAAAWIDGKISEIETLVNGLFSSLSRFWDDLGVTDLASPMAVLRRGANIVLGFIGDVVRFAVRAAEELLEMVKKFLLDKIVTFIKEKTTAYPLLTIILGKDPITDQKVDRNGTNILNALLELGGEEGKMQRDQMRDTGTFQKVAAYIDEGITVFGDLYDKIVQGFKNIWDYVSIDSLMDPIGTFEKIYNQFAAPVRRVLDFVGRVVAEILKLIKDVLFKRISAEAKKTRGYFLVTVIINKDPFTGEVVPRTIENIIHGFMSLMDGGEEQFQQMKESGAIDKTTAKINAAVKRLNMTPRSIIQLFIDLWNSFSFRDFLNPIATFKRIIAKFGEPIVRLISFVIEIVKIVVEVILIIMNFPFDLINNIIAKAMLAFELIKKNPIGFLKNLLRAIKEGFMQFFDNILTHLFNGLKAWFLSEVQAAGIPIPTDFSVMGIIKWLLAVLDVTMEKIWKKLEERIGKPKVDKIKKMIAMAEKVAGAAAEAYAFMQDVQQRGFMAVMIDKVKEQLSNVWEMVLDAVKSFVMDQIIKKVTAKLLSMLDPTGIMAVINSAIALYKAIQSFIRYLRQMLEIVNSFVEGTLQIAQGATKKAADFLESALARGIPIVIGFLANQVGLNLSERLRDALELVRAKVDKGLDWVIDKLVIIVEKLVSMGKAAVASLVQWWKGKKEFTANDTKRHMVYFEGDEANPVLTIKSDPTPYTNFLNNYEQQLGTEGSAEVTVNGVKKTKTAVVTEARGVAGNIETEKKKEINTYAGADDKAKEEAKKTAVDTLLQQLADTSVPLFGTEKPADSEIILPVGSNNHQFATSMEAVNIYKTPKVTGNGSAPTSAKHNIYDVIDNRQKGKASYYIRGHLINDNLGGPGMWSNMTALSRTGNHQHEGLVESKVKAAFDAGAVIRYKVTASGNQAAQTPTLADKNKFTKILDFDKNFALLVNIINAEKNVVTTLTCEAFTRKKQGNTWADDKQIVSTPVTNEVALSYDSYELGDDIQPATVNLNTADAEQLSRLASIGEGRAAKIIAYRATTIIAPPATKFFEKVEDVSKVEGIGAATVASLKSDPLVVL